ncbi:MAG: hypothetical protein RLO51_22075 [Thalassobaculum sp.]|uniref:hypothetical protein n=1 Tax=Thalassobaculum sp. TaxID=2022740 RepID=UPI0032ED49C5
MRVLLVLTLLLTVAACSTAGPSDRSADPSVPPTSALPVPTPRPGENKARPAAPVPVPRPERPSPPFDLGQLGGATESTVVSTLGMPDNVREQQPGKVWVYRHGGCQVEVFLYPSVDVGNMAVLGTALMPDTLAEPERDRCRRDLARRMSKPQ